MKVFRFAVVSGIVLFAIVQVSLTDEIEIQIPEIVDREEVIREQIEYAQRKAAEAQQKILDAHRNAEVVREQERRRAIDGGRIGMMRGVIGGGGGPGFGGGMEGSMMRPSAGFPGGYGRNYSYIIIPSGPMPGDTFWQLEEDMQIMNEVIRKKTDSQSSQRKSVNWIRDHFLMDSNIPDGIYIGDYGLVFFLRVNFPLRPEGFESSGQQEELSESSEPDDPVWNSAKRRLQGHPVTPKDTSKKIVYDQKKVDELTSNLIDCLKHSSNIRNLSSDQWIVIRASFVPKQSHMSRFMEEFGPHALVGIEEKEEEIQPMPSFLIVRAKKKDIDAFAAGQTNHHQFIENVSIVNF